MSVTIEISVVDESVSARLANIQGVLSDPSGLLREAAGDVKEFVQLYHEGFNWRGDHYISGQFSGQFQKQVAEDWQEPVMRSNNEAAVVNTDPYLSHKITGGTILPIKGRYLTIPLISEAKGLSPREYEGFTGETLFFAKTHGPGGGGVLAHNVLQTKGRGKGVFNIVPVYALATSVTQEPWPGAMPPLEDIQAVLDKAFAIELESVLTS